MALLTVILRLVFRSLRISLIREHSPREQQRNNSRQGLYISGWPGLAVVARYRAANGSDHGTSSTPEQRAETYLSRVVALTGATRMGSSYVLNVGEVRFHVRDGNVKRIPHGSHPTWARWETCFHPAQQDMPQDELIATVLLQLKNNPWIFDRWAMNRELPFKADGQIFNRPKCPK